MALVYRLILVAVALLVGWLVSSLTSIQWYIAAIVTYLVLRFIIEGIDALSSSKSTRCPKCNKKILTSNPVPCEECGGAAKLSGKNYPSK